MQNKIFQFLFTVLVLFLFGCAASPRFTKERIAEPKIKQRSTETISKNDRVTTSEGIASYYAHDFNGKKTANGEQYDMHSKTAAHRSFSFGTKVKVTNLENDKSVIVRINDRGPFKLDRIMDLSLGAAEELDMIKSGTARVRLEVVEWGTKEEEN
jgi:rare lipoprotein A